MNVETSYRSIANEVTREVKTTISNIHPLDKLNKKFLPNEDALFIVSYNRFQEIETSQTTFLRNINQPPLLIENSNSTVKYYVCEDRYPTGLEKSFKTKLAFKSLLAYDILSTVLADLCLPLSVSQIPLSFIQRLKENILNETVQANLPFVIYKKIFRQFKDENYDFREELFGLGSRLAFTPEYLGKFTRGPRRIIMGGKFDSLITGNLAKSFWGIYVNKYIKDTKVENSTTPILKKRDLDFEKKLNEFKVYLPNFQDLYFSSRLSAWILKELTSPNPKISLDYYLNPF